MGAEEGAALQMAGVLGRGWGCGAGGSRGVKGWTLCLLWEAPRWAHTPEGIRDQGGAPITGCQIPAFKSVLSPGAGAGVGCWLWAVTSPPSSHLVLCCRGWGAGGRCLGGRLSGLTPLGVNSSHINLQNCPSLWQINSALASRELMRGGVTGLLELGEPVLPAHLPAERQAWKTAWRKWGRVHLGQALPDA